MLFCDIKDKKLQDSLIKIYDMKVYEFLYLNKIYPITEQKKDNKGYYFQYMKSELLDSMLKEIPLACDDSQKNKN